MKIRLIFARKRIVPKAVQIAACILMAANGVHAQHSMVQITAAAARKQFAWSVMAGREWSWGKSEKWFWSTGLRYTGYLGSNQYYTTAPARLTTGSTGPLVLFKPNIPANMDSLQLTSPSVHAINLYVQVRFRVAQRWYSGFNIDVIGAAFGAQRTATYINGQAMQVTDTKPTAFNLLLISDNDRGTLNSEFFAVFLPSDRISIKAGLQFLFTEYTTAVKVQQQPEENGRFRNKSLMVSLGVLKYF
jgi:hypothetical protein